MRSCGRAHCLGRPPTPSGGAVHATHARCRRLWHVCSQAVPLRKSSNSVATRPCMTRLRAGAQCAQIHNSRERMQSWNRGCLHPCVLRCMVWAHLRAGPEKPHQQMLPGPVGARLLSHCRVPCAAAGAAGSCCRYMFCAPHLYATAAAAAAIQQLDLGCSCSLLPPRRQSASG
jgi:hypothetical protein